MKIVFASVALAAAFTAEAVTCESEMSIDVPQGITGLSFVGYDVDPASIVRSTGDANKIILKNYNAQPMYTSSAATGITVTAGDACTSGGGPSEGGGSAATAALGFLGGLSMGSPMLAGASVLLAGLPSAFGQACSNAIEVEIVTLATAGPPEGTNTCDGAKIDIPNADCVEDGIVTAVGQAGADVSVGYTGNLNTTWDPITEPYYTKGLCPVNVHWHLGAEHRSEGEYDENGTGPARRRLAEEDARLGLRCNLYDESDAKFTTPFQWQHCVNMKVGETYEIHWPHSAAGACGTINQYQTPFYDGVFCNLPSLEGLTPEDIKNNVGVQGQVFTIVNDEAYYYPDLMRGMIVDGDMGKDITKYTGSTTGTSRDNEICSGYAPITWQVDRKCHMISASSFDKMCADMKAQRDDMSDDLYPHGSRELVADDLAADNHQNRKLVEVGNFVY